MPAVSAEWKKVKQDESQLDHWRKQAEVKNNQMPSPGSFTVKEQEAYMQKRLTKSLW